MLYVIPDIQLRFAGWAASPSRAFKKAVRKGMLQLARNWKVDFLPRHFMGVAFTDYGYKRRNRFYQDRKFKKWGHRDPIRWSSDARDQAKSVSAVKSLRNRWDASYIAVNVPHYVLWNNYMGTGMQGELQMVLDDEIRRLGARLAKDIVSEMVTSP